MVGHSGRLEPTSKAVETVDACLGRIYQAMKQRGGGAWLITADHGNAELMVDPVTGGPQHGAHDESGAVHLCEQAGCEGSIRCVRMDRLRDISATILGLLNLAEPQTDVRAGICGLKARQQAPAQ